MRAYYIELEKILDEKVLTFPDVGTQLIYTTPRYKYGPQGLSSQVSQWQLHVDERLEWLPSYCEGPSNELYIEWVYILDLDREVVQIKGGGVESSFRLQFMPRQLEWAKDFEEEHYDEEDDESNDDPEDQENMAENPAKTLLGQPLVALLTPDAPSRSLLDKYDSFNVEIVKPQMLTRDKGKVGHTYTIRKLLFTHFVEKWSLRLSHYVLSCRNVDFMYREVVFAILSLAAGAFQLLADQSPLSDRSEHLGARLGSPNGPSILPDFGSGTHAPKTLPGSAPDSSSYWFKGVSVVLIDGLADEAGFKAAITTVVNLVQDSGYKTLDAIVTNIQSFMLVRVVGGSVVQHTDLIELVAEASPLLSQKESRDRLYSKPDDETRQVRGNTNGFEILMNFFDIVAAYTLKPFKTVAKGLPNELCDRIIEMADLDTYSRCSEVSYTFRHYVQQHVRLTQQPNLAAISHQSATFSHHVIKGVSSDNSWLLVFDVVEGQDVESELRPWNDGDVGQKWAPIIGHGNRQSMMLGCAVTIPALASYSLPLAEDHHPEIDDDADYTTLLETLSPVEAILQKFGRNHYYIPKIAGAKDVALAWETYMHETLMKSPVTGQRMEWNYSSECHRYLLPRNTACILLQPDAKILTDAEGNHYDEFAGMFWLKKRADLDVANIRERALSEAQDHLNDWPQYKAEQRRPMRQGLLVVAFGTKVRCFEWEFCEAVGIQPALTPMGDGAFLNVNLAVERERFERIFFKFLIQAEARRKAAAEEGDELD